MSGHEEDERRHAQLHEEYARGPLIPILDTVPGDDVGDDRFVWIDANVPQPVRNAASRVAYVECRELNRPVCYDGSDTQERPRLLLALRGQRAIGMLMMADTEQHWRMRWVGGHATAISRTRVVESRSVIGRLWIAADHRQRGLGSALARAAAAREQCEIAQLAWTIPFTTGGAALVQSLCPGEWLADGSWDDLFVTLGERDE